MNENFGISAGGRPAEELFRRLTGATPSPRAVQGDAVLEGHPVEIKQASTTTLNQVRAVKYIPLMVYVRSTEEWYVVPVHVVVASVNRRRRGQHTENPFESATLNLNALRDYRLSNVAQLRQATLDAIRSSAEFPELQEAMNQVLRESRELAEVSVQRVRTLLEQLGLRTPETGA